MTLIACSDDDDSGNGTNGGGEVATKVYQDGVEGVMNYFYETDSSGKKTLVMGTALNKNFPDVLSMRVSDEKDAYGHFEAMLNSVDSTCITVHVDRSITVNLTDTLGNVKGTAEFVLVNEGGVVASVTFSDGLIEGVSKVDFILESAWPQNDDEKAKQKHFRGNKIYCQVPVVVREAPGSSWWFLSETETRREPLTCVNEPSAGTPAYYVYFDTTPLSEQFDENGVAPPTVRKYLPTKSTAEANSI